MILIWVYNRMQPLTNQDLPAMAAVLCNRQTIFRRQTIFPKLDTGSHEALTALTVAPIRRRKWRSGGWFTFSYSNSLQRRWFILTPIGTNKSKLTTWKVDKKKVETGKLGGNAPLLGNDAWINDWGHSIPLYITLFHSLIPCPFSTPLFLTLISCWRWKQENWV